MSAINANFKPSKLSEDTLAQADHPPLLPDYLSLSQTGDGCQEEQEDIIRCQPPPGGGSLTMSL